MAPTPDYHEMFDQRGAGYDDAMARWPRARDEEFGFAARLAAARPGERVLDVPAGGGYFAEHLPEGVEHLALEEAASFADRCRRRGVPVVVGALRGDALAAASVDVVVSVAGLHHEPDLDAVLAGWHRLLRPGGRVVVADVAVGSAESAFLDGFVGRHNGVGHDGTYLDDRLAERLDAAGFTDIRVEEGRYHWWFDTEEELGRFCAGLFGLVGPSWQEVVDAARQGPGMDVAPDGRVGLRWGLRAGVAVRAEE